MVLRWGAEGIETLESDDIPHGHDTERLLLLSVVSAHYIQPNQSGGLGGLEDTEVGEQVLEWIYYNSVQEKHKELSSICGDFDNQLSVIVF